MIRETRAHNGIAILPLQPICNHLMTFKGYLGFKNQNLCHLHTNYGFEIYVYTKKTNNLKLFTGRFEQDLTTKIERTAPLFTLVFFGHNHYCQSAFLG